MAACADRHISADRSRSFFAQGGASTLVRAFRLRMDAGLSSHRGEQGMIFSYRWPAVATCVVLLGGCATTKLQPYQSAHQLTKPSHYVMGPSAPFDDHLHRFLDDRHSVLYMQNQGGGGAVVGALFGPLGVLGNIAAIKKQTEADAQALKGHLPIDVMPLLAEAMIQTPGLVPDDADPQAAKVSPMLYVEKVDENQLRFAAWLAVQSTMAGKPWSRQYVYELPVTYSKDQVAAGLDPAQLAQLKESLEDGFRWAATTYSADSDGAFQPRERGTLRSDFVTPRIQLALNGYRFDAGARRVGFATGAPSASAIYSLPADTATVSEPK